MAVRDGAPRAPRAAQASAAASAARGKRHASCWCIFSRLMYASRMRREAAAGAVPMSAAAQIAA